MLNDSAHFVRSGFRLLRREGPITLLRDAIDEFSPDDAGRLTRILSEDAPVFWVAADKASVVRDRTADYDDFYTCFEESPSDEQYTVSTDRPFDTLEFDVVGRSDVSEFTVVGELETASGETITERRRFRGTPNRWDDHSPESVSVSAAEPLIGATIRLDWSPDPGREIRNSIRALGRDSSDEVAGPRVTLPALRSRTEADRHPIVLISVDTFRYDYLECFEPLIKAMGEDAVIPEQPRTHAPETKSVHGSMFTGTYPGDHGYVMRGDREYIRPIDPSLTTLGELLAEHRYKCSGLATHPNLTADRGFARGFHRYQIREMDWQQRRYDARTNVDTCLKWLDDDLRHPDRRLFYFLHLFDPHVPYFPPDPMYSSENFDQSKIEELKRLNRHEAAPDGCPVDYLRVLEDDANPGEGFDVDAVTEWYRESLTFVARQLARLVRELKRRGIYDEALVIVVGDHGEEFFERKFAMHNTLYDAVVRPGTIVKPPANSDLVVPDKLDIVDILPTVASLVGADIPDQCVGSVWDGSTSDRTRIAERVWVDWYGISVEMEGFKGIFTFDDNFPDRPTSEQRTAGPVEAEFYDVAAVQNGDYDRVSPDERLRSELLDSALKVMRRETVSTGKRVGKADDDILDKLEELGYR